MCLAARPCARVPGVALFAGSVGERRGRHDREPSGELAPARPGEQPLGFDFDPGVDERRGQAFGEILELVGTSAPDRVA
jgi:hypothetical protein